MPNDPSRLDLSPIWPALLEAETASHADEARRWAEAAERTATAAARGATDAVEEILGIRWARWQTHVSSPSEATVVATLATLDDWPDLPDHPAGGAYRWALAYRHPNDAPDTTVDLVVLDIDADGQELIIAGRPTTAAAQLPRAILELYQHACRWGDEHAAEVAALADLTDAPDEVVVETSDPRDTVDLLAASIVAVVEAAGFVRP